MPARWRTKKKMKKNKDVVFTRADIEFLDRIQSGDKSAFDELVGKYEGRLYNFGLKVCKNVRDAEDLVQETFINVYKSLGGFRKEAKLKNWVFSIAANACRTIRRKSRFAPETELSFEEFIPSDHSKIENRPGWASAPVEQLLNSELSSKIKEAVNALPDRYKLVLVLRDMEGFSTEETAAILSISPQNVKVRLHRARLFLREELKAYYETGPTSDA